MLGGNKGSGEKGHPASEVEGVPCPQKKVDWSPLQKNIHFKQDKNREDQRGVDFPTPFFKPPVYYKEEVLKWPQLFYL